MQTCPTGNAPDKNETALLLIDVINDLAFPEAERMLGAAKNMARNLLRLRERARRSGVPIIYVNDNFGKWQSDFRVTIEHCLGQKVRGREIARILQPEDDDYFVLKPKHSGFFSTTLETLLRYLGSRRLVLTGIAGNFCVLFTANDAYMRDYDLVVPRDCTVSNTPRENAAALGLMRKFLKAKTPLGKDVRFPRKTNAQTLAPGGHSAACARSARRPAPEKGAQGSDFPRLRGNGSRGIDTTPFSMATVSEITSDPALESQLFWEQYKTTIIAVAAVLVLGGLGFAGYQIYTMRAASDAVALLAAAHSPEGYQKVIERYPGSEPAASAALLLAGQQRAQKNYAEANTTLRKFIDQYPKHQLITTAWMGVAANLESLGKTDEALSTYQRLATEYPQSFNAPLALLAQVPLLKAKNRIDEARRACETIMSQHRDSIVANQAIQELMALPQPAAAAMPKPAPSMAPSIPMARPPEVPAPKATP